MAVAESAGVKIGPQPQNSAASVQSQDLNGPVGDSPNGSQSPTGDRPRDISPKPSVKADRPVAGTLVGYRNGSKGLSDMRELVDILSKLNPMAEEFVPPSVAHNHVGFNLVNGGFGYPSNFVLQPDAPIANGYNGRR
ncbi:hypothetical protein CRG98_025702, partial [Punica granatum]